MQTRQPAPAGPHLPDPDFRVDFGGQQPGSEHPMPDDRRREYEQRIRNAADSQAAGAERASQLFVR